MSDANIVDLSEVPEDKLPNPFQSAMEKFTNMKVALSEAETNLDVERNTREERDRQLAEMNARYEAYKATVEVEVKTLRQERDWLQAYTTTLRTRMAVISEIVQVAMREAEQYATRVVRGGDVATDEEVTDSIREHFNREKGRQEREEGEGKARPYVRPRTLPLDDR